MNNRMTSIVKPNINLFFLIKVHVDKENIDIYTCTYMYNVRQKYVNFFSLYISM